MKSNSEKNNNEVNMSSASRANATADPLHNYSQLYDQTPENDLSSVRFHLPHESEQSATLAQQITGTAKEAVASATLSAAVGVNVIRSTHLPPEISYLIASYTREKTLATSPGENRGWEMCQLLGAENSLAEVRGYVIPFRRICNFARFDSISTQEGAAKTSFITDEEIIKIHPMRFLRNSPFLHPMTDWYRDLDENSPLWDRLHCEHVNTRLHAIAVTESGKHVILQQSGKSCVPTCVAMLVLDHAKAPNYRALQCINLASASQACEWMEQAGLVPLLTWIDNSQNTARILRDCLRENGPGVLSIDHPEIRGHVVILDEISETENTAIVRDPYHGWSLTIKLDSLLSWCDQHDYFLQVQHSQA
jgi:hypothetical protein